ncbi:hypothetical protein QOT17_007949 [Balamuthia mandrillaris]
MSTKRTAKRKANNTKTKEDTAQENKPSPPKKGKKAEGESSTSNSTTSCPLSLEEFLNKATELETVIIGPGPDDSKQAHLFLAKPHKHSTGSFGWTTSGRKAVTVGGENLSVQFTINMTVLGSKQSGAGSSNQDE